MSPVHMTPEEAVRVHEILGAKTSIAIHHGTLQLSDVGIDTPQKQLMPCRREDSFLILRSGQSAEIRQSVANAHMPDPTLSRGQVDFEISIGVLEFADSEVAYWIGRI